MSGRVPLVAGNWKMHKTVTETEELIGELLPLVERFDGVEVAVCPPFTALSAAVRGCGGSAVGVYAQNMHHEDHGAFTGEIAPAMLSSDPDSTIIVSACLAFCVMSGKP